MKQASSPPSPSTPDLTRRKTRTRKTGLMRYFEGMTAEAILEKSVRYDRGGKPVEVVIPYEQFIDFIETYGLDLTDEEKQAIREAEDDRLSGNKEAFIPLAELEKELGI